MFSPTGGQLVGGALLGWFDVEAVNNFLTTRSRESSSGGGGGGGGSASRHVVPGGGRFTPPPVPAFCTEGNLHRLLAVAEKLGELAQTRARQDHKNQEDEPDPLHVLYKRVLRIYERAKFMYNRWPVSLVSRSKLTSLQMKAQDAQALADSWAQLRSTFAPYIQHAEGLVAEAAAAEAQRLDDLRQEAARQAEEYRERERVALIERRRKEQRAFAIKHGEVCGEDLEAPARFNAMWRKCAGLTGPCRSLEDLLADVKNGSVWYQLNYNGEWQLNVVYHRGAGTEMSVTLVLDHTRRKVVAVKPLSAAGKKRGIKKRRSQKRENLSSGVHKHLSLMATFPRSRKW